MVKDGCGTSGVGVGRAATSKVGQAAAGSDVKAPGQLVVEGDVGERGVGGREDVGAGLELGFED